MNKVLFLTLLLAFLASYGIAQKAPFWEEIQNYKKQDSTRMPPTRGTLFVGSSSIRLWNDLTTAFPNHQVINRGFGGSTLDDLLFYLNDIVLPYQPRQIFIYSGENDIATDSVTAEATLARLKLVIDGIRDVQPEVPIVFISIKPSPSRIDYLEEINQANKLIKRYLEDDKHSEFADVFHAMLDKERQPKADIFIEDRLHLNAKGYSIWQKILQPYLLK